ncbi:MAG: protein O-mannosyl-transferase family, partial [Longimicrobiales bacterium]
SLFTIALLSWLAFRWRDRLGEGKDDNLLLLIIFILALSVGNHLMAFLVAPALVLFILLVHPRTLLNWRLYAAGVLAGVLGLSIHLFLPIRSGLAPVINEAAPTCESIGGAMVSVLTMGGAGCENLSAALQRQQYSKPSVFENPITATTEPQPRDARLFFAQLANYLQYFDWQWARSLQGPRSWLTELRLPFTALFILLGLAGASTHYRRDRTSFAYFATVFLTLSLGLVFYLNFRYGFTLPEELMSRDVRALAGQVELREVRERDYFFIVSFSMWGLWAGIGLAAVWQDLAGRVGGHRPDQARSPETRSLLVAAPVMLIALLPLFMNWSWASRRNDYSTRDWAYNLLMSVEPYGILFTNGDNDTFPLWYLQEVEGIRRDVTVMVMSYLNTPWYVEQVRDLTAPCPPGVDPTQDPTRILCQRPYNGDGPEIYNEAMVPTDAPGVSIEDIPPGRRPPTRSIVPLTNEEIVEIANTPPYLLDHDRVFRPGNIETTLPRGTVVIPADGFMAAIINTAIGDRPIYFAMTTQAYDELNLRPYLIRQGVALKLNNGPVVPDTARGIIAVPPESLALGAPSIDLPRTETLVSDVFIHRGGFPDEWGHWVDAATEGIPFYYAFTHYGLAQVYQNLGREAEAARHLERGEAFARLGNRRREY